MSTKELPAPAGCALQRPCPLCQRETRPSLTRPDGLPVARCPDCELWYVSVRAGEISYSGYWDTLHRQDRSPKYAAEISLGDPYDLRLNRLEAIGGLYGKRLLDIGCGCGELLAAARARGAHVFGNDVSPEACRFVKDELSIPVWESKLNAGGFLRAHGQMDIVTMSDFIEHPSDPLGVLEAALRILRPGGLLLIHTPNGGVAGENWAGFRVDLEHLQYFSAATINILAQRYGLRIRHLETFGFPSMGGRSGIMTALRSRVRKIGPVRRLWEASRALRVRSGNYHLFAILEKLSSEAQNISTPR